MAGVYFVVGNGWRCLRSRECVSFEVHSEGELFVPISACKGAMVCPQAMYKNPLCTLAKNTPESCIAPEHIAQNFNQS